MKNLKLLKPLLLLVVVSISAPAFAKKGKRSGFNFGTGISLESSNDRTLGSSEFETSLHTKKASQTFTPYIGYSFGGVLNFGLSFSAGEHQTQEVEKRNDGQVLSDRQDSTTAKNASIFTRFLFGKILFFEGGFGIYQEKTDIHNTTTLSQEGGLFAGEIEDYSISGSGPGYHVGGGFEIPTGGGFYFTGSYLNKVYQINDGESVFGKGSAKKAYQQKKVLTFGLAHYYK